MQRPPCPRREERDVRSRGPPFFLRGSPVLFSPLLFSSSLALHRGYLAVITNEIVEDPQSRVAIVRLILRVKCMGTNNICALSPDSLMHIS